MKKKLYFFLIPSVLLLNQTKADEAKSPWDYSPPALQGTKSTNSIDLLDEQLKSIEPGTHSALNWYKEQIQFESSEVSLLRADFTLVDERGLAAALELLQCPRVDQINSNDDQLLEAELKLLTAKRRLLAGLNLKEISNSDRAILVSQFEEASRKFRDLWWIRISNYPATWTSPRLIISVRWNFFGYENHFEDRYNGARFVIDMDGYKALSDEDRKYLTYGNPFTEYRNTLEYVFSGHLIPDDYSKFISISQSSTLNPYIKLFTVSFEKPVSLIEVCELKNKMLLGLRQNISQRHDFVGGVLHSEKWIFLTFDGSFQ